MAKKLLIFDCDGVLIDSELISAEMLIKTLADNDVFVDLAYVADRFLGRSYPTVLAQIRDEFNVELPRQFEETYRERLLASFETQLKASPGILDVLRHLGIQSCVATSSSPERVSKSLSIVGMTKFFVESIFTASLVPNGKPAPDLFLLAAESFGVDPVDCLVIEDSRNGIAAAKAAGMEVWRYTGGSHIDALDKVGRTTAAADFAFDDFADFYTHAPALTKIEAERG